MTDTIDNEKIENLKEKSNWGGRREGAGRAKGSMNKATRDEKIVAEELRQRVLRSAQRLLDSQMNLAQGVQMLYKIKTDKKGQRSKPELVTSQSEIEEYLAGEKDNLADEYYFITTERPDNRALDSLFDRTLGKASQKFEVDINATVAVEKIEKDLQNLLYDRGIRENTESGEAPLQGGGRQAPDTDREPVRDVQVDNPTGAEEIVVECSHEVREILDGSPGSANQSD